MSTSRDGVDTRAIALGQQRAVAAAADGRDVLTVMAHREDAAVVARSAGASAGTTLVVTTEANTETGTETGERRRGGRADAALVVSPGQLACAETVRRLAEAGPSMVVIEDAQRISSWGDDFRPEYLRLGEVIDALGHPTVVALATTSAAPVRSEIAERLHLRDPEVVVQGFARPNLTLAVRRHDDPRTKERALLDHVADVAGRLGRGVVFVNSRRRAERVALGLTERGVGAVAWHAGIGRRRADQARRQFGDRIAEVLVTTTSIDLGLGDRNLRFVVHGDIPESLETYYREIDIAGRDGDPAEVSLVYCPADVSLPRLLAAGSARDATDGSADDAGSAAGVLRRAMQASRLEMIREYAEVAPCRWHTLLSTFGEPSPSRCGHCDRCFARRAS